MKAGCVKSKMAILIQLFEFDLKRNEFVFAQIINVASQASFYCGLCSNWTNCCCRLLGLGSCNRCLSAQIRALVVRLVNVLTARR